MTAGRGGVNLTASRRGGRGKGHKESGEVFEGRGKGDDECGEGIRDVVWGDERRGEGDEGRGAG